MRTFLVRHPRLNHSSGGANRGRHPVAAEDHRRSSRCSGGPAGRPQRGARRREQRLDARTGQGTLDSRRHRGAVPVPCIAESRGEHARSRRAGRAPRREADAGGARGDAGEPSPFGSKLRVLAENVRRHVAEEETELLPLLERSLDDERRRELGAVLDRAKRAAPTRPHPAAPDTPPGIFVAGAVAAVYDRSRDALRGGTDVLRTLGVQGANRTFEGAKMLAERARRGGRAAVRTAAEQGRAAVNGAASKGREAVDQARESTARVEMRGAEAASTVSRAARAAANRTRAGGTRSTRRRTAGSRKRSEARR